MPADTPTPTSADGSEPNSSPARFRKNDLGSSSVQPERSPDVSPDPPHRPRRRSRARRVLIVLTVFTLAFGAFNVYYALRPEALSERVDAALSEYLAFPYHFSRVEWLGVREGIRVHDLVVDSPEGSHFEHVLEITELDLRLDWWKAIRGDMPLRLVTVRRPKVFVEVDPRDQTIPLGQMLKPLPPTPPDQVPPAIPSVVVEDLELQSCPLTIYQLDEPVRVGRFRFDLLENRRYQFSGTAQHPLVREIRLVGKGHRYERSFAGRLEISQLDLDSIRQNLAPGFLETWESYDPKGKASAVLSFRLEDGGLTEWHSTLSVRNGSLRLEEPPVLLESVTGQVEISPEVPVSAGTIPGAKPSDLTPTHLRIVELAGRAWGGQASLTGQLELDEFAVVDSRLVLTLEQIPLDRNIRAFLAETDFAWLDSPKTRGRLDLELDIRGDAGHEVAIRKIRLEETSFRPDHFPYAVDDITGELRARSEGGFALDVTGRLGPGRFTLVGEGDWAAPAPLDLQLKIEDVPIDYEIYDALPEAAREVWREYDPGGRADIDVGITRAAGADLAPFEVSVALRNASLRYAQFPYSLERVTGRVGFRGEVSWAGGFEIHPQRLDFTDLVGYHGENEVHLERGEFVFALDPRDRGRIDLPIRCEHLRVDEALIRALPHGLVDLIRSFNVVGAPSVQVRLFHRDDGELDLTVGGRFNSPVSVRYTHVPYPLTFDRGEFEFVASTGITRFEDFRTPDDFSPRLLIDGQHRAHGAGGQQHLSLLLAIEPDANGRGLDLGSKTFVQSMPKDVRTLLETLAVRGGATGRLKLDYKFTLEGGSPTQHNVVYESDARVRNGAVNFGIRLSEVQTTLKLYGGFDRTRNHSFRVQVSKGEFRFSRFRLTDVFADVTYGRVHNIIHDARSNPDERNVHYRPRREFLDRLVPAQVEHCLQIHLSRANLYDGPVKGFLYLDTQRRDFMGDFECERVDLALAAPSLFQSQSKAKGLARGAVDFHGDLDDPSNMRGSGWFRIEDGQLTTLPILQTFLTHVVFGFFGLDPSLRVVTEVRARFLIQNRRFVFPDFEDLVLIAPSTRAVATGYMDFDQNVKLRLENRGSMLGIPLLSPAVDRLTGVSLEGKLDELRAIE